MKLKNRILQAKIELYELLNEADKNDSLSDSDSEILFQLENNPDLAEKLESEDELE